MKLNINKNVSVKFGVVKNKHLIETMSALIAMNSIAKIQQNSKK